VSLTPLKKNYFLLLIALLFIASAASSLIMLNKSQRLLTWNERATGWALVQLVLLQQSYNHALLQYQQGKDVYDELLTYYDLNWSAYQTLTEGSDDVAFATKKLQIEQLKLHFKEFKRADPLENKLTDKQVSLMLEQTNRSYNYALELLNYEFQGFSMKRHNRDFVLVKVNKIIVMSLLGLCFSGALFLFIIMRDRRRMTYMAYHDGLTTLKNRHALQEKITWLHDNKAPFCTLLMDIDGFKLVNDQYGHDVGDKLLIYLAQKLKDVCEKPNIVGRLGGDEFALVCLDINSLKQILEALLEITSEVIVIDEFDCDIGLSIGVSCSLPDHDTWIDVLKEADHAMYEAKGRGGNQYKIYDHD